MNKIYLNRPIKGISVKGEIIKEKIIIHNTDKILFFKSNSRNDEFFIPRMSNESLFEGFIEKFVVACEEEPFFESIKYEPRFESVNSSLKKIYYEYIRRYFSCYMEFDEKLIGEISDFAFEANLEPHLFTFEEVKNLDKNKSIKFDYSIPDVVNVLDQKIKKYVR